jgi:hypothetical protein
MTSIVIPELLPVATPVEGASSDVRHSSLNLGRHPPKGAGPLLPEECGCADDCTHPDHRWWPGEPIGQSSDEDRLPLRWAVPVAIGLSLVMWVILAFAAIGIVASIHGAGW